MWQKLEVEMVGEQIRKTQAEPQWIVAQRLLSALTIPGFNYVTPRQRPRSRPRCKETHMGRAPGVLVSHMVKGVGRNKSEKLRMNLSGS